jgi:hypothetical protein
VDKPMLISLLVRGTSRAATARRHAAGIRLVENRANRYDVEDG